MAAPKQGGFKMSLGALKGKPGLKAAPTQKDNKKSKLLLGDDEPDDSVKQQEITGWDAAEGGAVEANGKKEKEAPRIIPVQPNRDWRSEARRKQLAKAPHHQAQSSTVDEKQIEEPKVQYGLTVINKDEAQEETTSVGADAPEPMEVEQDTLTEEQRLEKKALDALISGKPVDNDLVIPIQAEEEKFLNDLHDAPEAPTLASYEATPIEGFGAALLRGMGWKGEETPDKNGAAPKPKEIKRRPALLGIGAKEEAATGVELGEFGGGKGKGKGKNVAQSYNPVTLRNKHTGEMITEEELKAKLENQSLVQEEPPSKAKNKYDDASEDDKRQREKRRGKRDDRERDRRRDDYYDSDRRRDKRRERTRDEDYDSERRREKRRERSHSPDDRKDKRRDRYRSRSRDSKRKSDRRDRSRSRDSDERRKRRRERDYDDDERYERKRDRDDKYYK
ncbi:pre-mrna-splicing factor spp2 [Stemphylium lycopersici]|uniref:Pre-mRNA-splicing factor n=1 Tax=Stemphylium lycopersici TaxID=183478 RepID=A0A364NF98_STELY|nr:pre-mrna-splicing factor spp2 [Stemphylium lycopersici]